MYLGPVHLIVSDLDRSVAFYQDAIGLQVHELTDHEAALGTAGDTPLLVLEAEPGARRAGRHAGLYHVALLYPSRDELARALQRLAVTRTPIEGASDHGVSEAIYLPDPDGNGLELYRDRPREQWPPPAHPGEKVAMFTQPLDLQALYDTVAADAPRRHAAPGLTVGHVHLHVNDLPAAVAFYTGELGLDVMTMYGDQAAFLSWDGYHHHVGLNTWRGAGVPGVPAAGVVGMRHFTVVGGDGDERTLVDPAGNAVRQASQAAAARPAGR
jgi:catechol 2,3-dioxygenase